MERYSKDASGTFFNEFDSIEITARLNHDSLNDRGEGMIGYIPPLHMERLEKRVPKIAV